MTYESMLAETVAFRGHNGDVGEAYYARPLGGGPWPGVVLIHHMPGWDEWIKEATRKLAHHGLATIAPHLYFREGPGSPDDVGARVRAAGGVADEQVLGDVAGSMEFLRAQPYANGRVGVIGFCSGGRHTYLAAHRSHGETALPAARPVRQRRRKSQPRPGEPHRSRAQEARQDLRVPPLRRRRPRLFQRRASGLSPGAGARRLE